MVSPESLGDRSSSLVSGLRLLRERWWIIALCFVLGASVAVALDKRKTAQYQATATLLLGATGTNVSGVLNANASSVSNDPQRDQGTTLLLVTSSSVTDRVRRLLKLPESSKDLATRVVAEAEADANLINITATDPNPQKAADLATAFAEEYKQFRQQSDRAGLAQGVRDLQQQLDRTPATATTLRASLSEALGQLSIVEAASTGGVQVVDRPTAPTSPALPRTKRDAVLGGLLGLAFGAVLLFALDLFDRRLKTVSDFESAYGMTAIASISVQDPDPESERERLAMLEPFRILRSGLQLMDPDGRVRVVMVTSAVPEEGKSTTAAGLAQAVAFSGARVALVEMDLRRPTFHQRFRLGGDPRGLTSVLLGEASVTDLLRRPVPEFPTLAVLPAGGLPQRSAELLGGPEMGRVLRALRERFDMVVLDAPPLLPVADTRVLLDAADIDACLVVGRASKTTREQAARARSILEQHRVRHRGLVVNGLKGDAMRYEYQGDYYGELGTDAPADRAEVSLGADARQA